MTTFSTRINTLLLLLVVLMAGAIIAILATRASGGPLDPPGAPAPTDGVRGPGTPISSLPFVISQPGFYYVTRPLTGAAGLPGITITTSNVTVDLGGFTLTGGTTPLEGINVPFGRRNIVIRNGAVRSWSFGIDAAPCSNCRVDGVQASSNTNVGIRIGPQSEISDCNASLNGNDGIHVSYGTVRNCTVSENGFKGILVGNGSLVEGNRLHSNTNSAAISVSGSNATIRNNELSGNNGGGDIQIQPGVTGNVIMGNVYCLLFDLGTNTLFTGNVDRIGVC